MSKLVSVDSDLRLSSGLFAPFFEDPYGVPAIAPPWGTLNAVDLARGEIL